MVDAPPEADGADRDLPEAPPRGARPRGADRRGLHRLRGAPAPLAADPEQARARLSHLLDENEFLRPTASALSRAITSRTRSSSTTGGQEYRVQYLPAESNTGMFGGNSNWRGPIWMPVNRLIVRGLLNLYGFYGDEFKVECPTGSGNRMTLFEVAKEIPGASRASSCATRAAAGPVYGGSAKFQDDPHWRDLVLFYEYFHGDIGAGLGASHQTGWTGLIAPLLDLFGRLTAEDALETPRERLEARLVREQVGGKRSRTNLVPNHEGDRHASNVRRAAARSSVPGADHEPLAEPPGDGARRDRPDLLVVRAAAARARARRQPVHRHPGLHGHPHRLGRGPGDGAVGRLSRPQARQAAPRGGDRGPKGRDPAAGSGSSAPSRSSTSSSGPRARTGLSSTWSRCSFAARPAT